MRNVSGKTVQKIQTHFMFDNFFPENRAGHEIILKKKKCSRAGHRWQHCACALHAGYL